MRNRGNLRVVLATALLLVAVTVTFSWCFVSVRWRAEALGMMLTGELTGLPWSEFWTEVASSPFVTRRNSSPLRQDGPLPCPVLWETPIGSFWGGADEGELLSALVQEQIDRKIYLNSIVSVAEGDVVVDVGSHLGTFTRLALMAGARLVIAFEPEPKHVACFRRTFHDEIRQGRVILVEAAAWRSPGFLTFSRASGLGSGAVRARRRGRGGTIVVEAVRIDDVVAEAGYERIDFIKMDIEGGERHALRGALRTLERFSPKMALCSYHDPVDRTLLAEIALAAQPGYTVVKRYHQVYFVP